jgi:hypothetical protein
MCEQTWDEDVHGDWICPLCEMAAIPNVVVESDATEIEELANVLAPAKHEIQSMNSRFSGAVFPAFVHESRLTEATLDLLVLLFDHVLLFESTFNFEENEKQRIADKIEAYVEAGYLSLFSWTVGSLSVSRRQPHIVPPPIRYDSMPLSIHPYIERLAQILTFNDYSLTTRQERCALWKDCPIPFVTVPTKEEEWIIPALEIHWRYHIQNRLNGFLVLCEILGTSILTDPVLKGAIRLKNVALFQHKHPDDLLFGLMDWYREKLIDLPQLSKPEMLLKIREESGPDSFVNYVIDVYDSRRTKSSDKAELMSQVVSAIDKQVRLAQLIGGRSYQRKKLLLSGLIGTIGGFLGGEVGAIIAGVGARMVPEGIEYLDRQRVAPWSTFFVDVP